MAYYSIIIENLCKRYVVREGFRRKHVVEALRGVSFNVERGSVHALLGPNGAGKTTLVKVISTILLPDSGRVVVENYDVVREAEKVRRIIGVVLDISKGFYLSLSALENLIFYGMLKGMSKKEAEKRARELLELVGLDETARRRPYYTYSLGMRARVSIAKALMTDPDVLILDEPTLGLDVESARLVRELIVRLAKEGRTILVTGHNMHEIEMIADKVTIIHRGRVVASGKPDELKLRVGLCIKVSMKVRENPEKVINIISNEIEIMKYEYDTNMITMYVRGRREDVVQKILNVLSEHNVKLEDFQISEPSLEDVYIAVVRGE